MDKEKRTAIIIVNYNGWKDTIDCVNSILKQNSENITVIIVDNQSTDNSYEKLMEVFILEKDVIVLQSHINGGFAYANNIGAKYALEKSAEYIVFLNNDTIIEKNAIRNIVECLEKDRLTVYTGKILYYYDTDKIWYAGGVFYSKKGSTEHIGFGEKDLGQYNVARKISFLCGCYMAFTRECLVRCGPMPEKYFLYGEDLAYSLQIGKKGVEMCYTPNSVIYHKISASTSKMGDFVQYYMIRNRMMAIQDYLEGTDKFCAYIYSIAWALKRVARHEYHVRNAMVALKDFCLKRNGKYME